MEWNTPGVVGFPIVSGLRAAWGSESRVADANSRHDLSFLSADLDGTTVETETPQNKAISAAGASKLPDLKFLPGKNPPPDKRPNILVIRGGFRKPTIDRMVNDGQFQMKPERLITRGLFVCPVVFPAANKSSRNDSF